MKRAMIHLLSLVLLASSAQAEFKRVEVTVLGMD
jgi:hypothetical protein